MSLAHGSQIARDGLVFHYDMSNPRKSWRGAPTTNLLYDSGVINWTIGNLVAAVTRTTVVENSVYRITSTTGGAFRLAVPLSKLTNGLSYNLSYKYKIISGGPVFNMTDWNDLPIFNVVNTQVDGYFFSSAYGTRSTYDNTYRFMDFTISANTIVEIQDVQLEQRLFATPFVAGTRSNTQAIVDLTKKNNIVATSPTYNSDGTFSFSGGTERLDISNTIGPIANNFSISAWVNSTNITATQNIVSMNGPYFMRISGSKVRFNVLAGGTWLFQNGTTTLSSNTWYNFCMVYNYDNSTWTGYINGVQEFSVAKTGTVSNTSFFGYVGYTPQGGEQSNFLGQIAVVQYYNRSLSAVEAAQNFEALRDRYGV